MTPWPKGLHFATIVPLWVDGVRRWALWVVLISVISAGFALHYTAGHLGINTDTEHMLSADLAWRRTYIDYEQAFPQYSNTLAVVIEGVTPELAEQAARSLAERLQKDVDLVEWVYRPGGGVFFEQHALLYLDTTELAELADNLTRIQPFLGKLNRDPSLRGLLTLTATAIEAQGQPLDLDLAPILERLAGTLDANLAGRFKQLSWQALMLGRSATGDEKRRFLVVRPKLDYSRLLPAGPVIERIRGIARELRLDSAHGVRVRITGDLAMSYEELATLSRGAGSGSLVALVMVSIVLFAGLRSPRLVFASLVTLLVGLAWTAAFAAYAVGHLNLISIAFAVLYIGMGVDYAIHFCLRYRELVGQGKPPVTALHDSAGDVGGSLVLCALTTGIGFFAFVPTDFSGVSELGLISGTGMFISLVASLTVLPALLTLMPLPAPLPQAAPAATGHAAALGIAYPYRRAVLLAMLVLGLGSLISVHWVSFDRNPLNLREPAAESVATYRDLLAESDTSPWSMVVVTQDAQEAAAVKARLNALELVDSTVSLQDFIPQDAAEKLLMIEELGLVLGLEFDAGDRVAPPSLREQRAAIRTLRRALEGVLQDPEREPIHGSAQRLRAALQRLKTALAGEHAPPAGDVLRRLEHSLLSTLSDQLRLLHSALAAGRVEVSDLPPEVVERWRSADGRYRVEVFPRENLNDSQALRRFVAAVQSVAPNATDAPLINLESGNVVVRAFQQAFVSAVVLIALLLWLLLRRIRDVVMVLTPLLLASALTVMAMVVLGIPFNFANVITLPLLLGIGVDNGIHMVLRMRAAPPMTGTLLQTSTTRAMITSALTTICGFGTLAFSAHRGTASMGQVLSIGLALTLLSTLVVLPAMLETGRRNRLNKKI